MQAGAAIQRTASSQLTATRPGVCGLVRAADREQYLGTAQQILEVLRHHDSVLLVFRVACGFGKSLADGSVDFARFHRFLARAGLAEPPATSGRAVDPGMPADEPDTDPVDWQPPPRQPSEHSDDEECEEEEERVEVDDGQYLPADDQSPRSSSSSASSALDGATPEQRERRKQQFRRLRDLSRWKDEGAQAAAERGHRDEIDSAVKVISGALGRREAGAQRRSSKSNVGGSEGPSGILGGAGGSTIVGPAPSGRWNGRRKLKLHKLEVDALFVQCAAHGRETLALKDFVMSLLRLSELLYPDDFSASPQSALQFFLQSHMYGFLSRMAPSSEEALRSQVPLQQLPDVPAILFAYEAPVRNLFCRFAAKQQGESGTATVDVTSARLNFEGAVAFFAAADVFPKLITHADIYRTMREVCNDGSGENLDLSAFTDIVIRLSWIMFSSEPHNRRLPTIASRLHCFLDRLVEMYSREFGRRIADDLMEEEKGLPRVHAVHPPSGSVAGGYDIVITGRDFCRQRGVFVQLGEVTVTALAVKESKIKVRVPPQEHNDFSINMRIVDNTYYCRVTFVRRVCVTASNDGQTYTEPSPNLVFTYERVGHDFHLADMQAKILTVFVEYCSRDDYYNDRYLTLEKWVWFKRDHNLREVRHVGGIGGREDTSSTEPWFRELSVMHQGQAVVTFKRFLTAVVSCILSISPEASPYDGLRQMFGAESALNNLLLRNLNEEQSSLTMAKVRQLNTMLGMPGVLAAATSARLDVSPHPTGEDDVEGAALVTDALHSAGRVVNEGELEGMLIEFLRAKRDEDEYEAFEKWKGAIEIEAQRDRERRHRASAMPRPGKSGKREPTPPLAVEEQEEAQPVREPPRPPDSEVWQEFRTDLRDDTVLVPMQGVQSRRVARRGSAESGDSDESWESDDSLDDQIYQLGHGQLHELLLRFNNDHCNMVRRREFMGLMKYRQRIRDLRETVQSKDKEIAECRTLLRRMREVGMTGCGSVEQELDRQILTQTHLKIEREIFDAIDDEKEAAQRRKEEEKEDQVQEVQDRERERILQDFKYELAEADDRFRRMAGILADQTQWMESQQSVVEGLKDRLHITQAEAQAYQQLAENIEKTAALDPARNREKIKEIAEARSKVEDGLQEVRSRVEKEAEEVAEAIQAVTRSAAIDQLRMAASRGTRYKGVNVAASALDDLPRDMPEQTAQQDLPEQQVARRLSQPKTNGLGAAAGAQRASILDLGSSTLDAVEKGGKKGKKKPKKKGAAKPAAKKGGKKSSTRKSLTYEEKYGRDSESEGDKATGDGEAAAKPEPEPEEKEKPEGESSRPPSQRSDSKDDLRGEIELLKTRLELSEAEHQECRQQLEEKEQSDSRIVEQVAAKERELELLTMRIEQQRSSLQLQVVELEQRLREETSLERLVPEGAKGALVYQVSPDDTIEAIAEQFGADPDTLWAINDLDEGSFAEMQMTGPVALLVPLTDPVMETITGKDTGGSEAVSGCSNTPRGRFGGRQSVTTEQYAAARRQEFREHTIARGTDTLRAVCEKYGADEGAVRTANLLLPSTAPGMEESSDDPMFLAGIAKGVLRIPVNAAASPPPGTEKSSRADDSAEEAPEAAIPESPAAEPEASAPPTEPSAQEPSTPTEQVVPVRPPGVFVVQPMERRRDPMTGEPRTHEEFFKAGVSALWNKSEVFQQPCVAIAESSAGSAAGSAGTAATPRPPPSEHDPEAAQPGEEDGQRPADEDHGEKRIEEAGAEQPPAEQQPCALASAMLSSADVGAGQATRMERMKAIRAELTGAEQRLRELRASAKERGGAELASTEFEALELAQRVSKLRGRYLKYMEKWQTDMKHEAGQLKISLANVRHVVRGKCQSMLLLVRNELCRLIRNLQELPRMRPSSPEEPRTAPSSPASPPPPQVAVQDCAVECDMPYFLPLRFKQGISRSHVANRIAGVGRTLPQVLVGGGTHSTGFGSIPARKPEAVFPKLGGGTDGVSTLEHRRAEQERRTPRGPRSTLQAEWVRAKRLEREQRREPRIFEVQLPDHAESIAWRRTPQMHDRVPGHEAPYVPRGFRFEGEEQEDWVVAVGSGLYLPRQFLRAAPTAPITPETDQRVTSRKLPSRSEQFAPMLQREASRGGLKGGKKRLAGVQFKAPKPEPDPDQVPCSLMRLQPSGPAPSPPRGAKPSRRCAELVAAERRLRCSLINEQQDAVMRLQTVERSARLVAGRRAGTRVSCETRAKQSRQAHETATARAADSHTADAAMRREQFRELRGSRAARRADLRQGMADGKRAYAASLREKNELDMMFASRRRAAAEHARSSTPAPRVAADVAFAVPPRTVSTAPHAVGHEAMAVRPASPPAAPEISAKTLSGEQRQAVLQIAEIEARIAPRQLCPLPAANTLIRAIAELEAVDNAPRTDWRCRERIKQQAESRLLEQLMARVHPRAFTPQMRQAVAVEVLTPSNRRNIRPQTQMSGLFMHGSSSLPRIPKGARAQQLSRTV